MDITLERILSLIPHDETGKHIHGAKKDFAQSIGYDSGDVVSMWEKGTSKSYRNKLHEIAAKYDVSVEWLKGETDIKKPATDNDDGEISPTVQKIVEAAKKMDEEQLKKLLKLFELFEDL